ncbi:hypothetical protein HY493_05875 [Candidatus Woesearchaeota archaeon]|nr:hypothetical protein [Candidatus Woesearchaeota archaeon]
MKKVTFLIVLMAALSVFALSASAQVPPSETFDVTLTLQQGVRTAITNYYDTTLFVTYQGLTSITDPKSGATITTASYVVESAGADGTVYFSQINSAKFDDLTGQALGSYPAFSAQYGYWTMFRDGNLIQRAPATSSSADVRINGGKAFVLPVAVGKIPSAMEFATPIMDIGTATFFPPSAPITFTVEIHKVNADRTTTIIGSRIFSGTADTLRGSFSVEKQTIQVSEPLSSKVEYFVRAIGQSTYNGQERLGKSDNAFRVSPFSLFPEFVEFATDRVSVKFNAPIASITNYALSVLTGTKLDIEASLDLQPSKVYANVGSFLIKYNGRTFDVDIGGLKSGASTLDMKFKRNGILVPITALFDGRAYSNIAVLSGRINAKGEPEFTLLDTSNKAIAVVIAREVGADFTTATQVATTKTIENGVVIVIPTTAPLTAGSSARLDYSVVAENGATGIGFVTGTVIVRKTSATFSGSVTLDGQPADNVQVVALIGTTSCGTTTASRGAYSVDVASASTQPGCGTDGATVTFKVGGTTAQQTGTWQQGTFTQLNLVAVSNPFLNGGSLRVQGTVGPYATPFAGFVIQSVSASDAAVTVRVSGNNLFIDNAGPSTATVQLNKNGALVSVTIASGSSLKLIGPNSPVTDLLIVPLSSGVSFTGTSGDDKIFPVTVQKSLVGSAGVSRGIAPVNGYLQDGAGQVTLQGFGETRTASFDVFTADGKDFTKFKPNAAVLAPEQRQIVLEDASAGEACAPATLKYSTDFASPLVSKMFVTNTKNGQWTCSSGRAVGGSLLQVFDPDVLETNSEAVFIYDTTDTSWDVTATVVPPDGCVVDDTVKSTSVSQGTEALLFNIACPVETTGAMITGAVPGLNGKALGVSHKLVDKTKDGQGKQKNKASTLSKSIVVMERGQGRFAGQGAATASFNGNGAPQPAAVLLLVFAIGALYYLAVRKH